MARKILLADDSVTAQNMGRRILGDAGYEVITVNNGSAALKRIAENKPDLIVLDVYMPGYGGLEVCQRLKESPDTARIPVLLTVGKLEPFKAEDARRVRADAFVIKPFEANELLTALTKLEDRIVPGPEPHKSGRFAKAIAAVEGKKSRDAEFGDTDLGWKNRIIIPKKQAKVQEPEPEIETAHLPVKPYRDFDAKNLSAKEMEPKGFEPAADDPPSKLKVIYEEEEIANSLKSGLPAGIPADITPEEISAITSAAAALNRSTSLSDTSTPASLESVVPAQLEASVVPDPAEAITSAESIPAEPIPVDEPPTFAIFAESPMAESVSAVEETLELTPELVAQPAPEPEMPVAPAIEATADAIDPVEPSTVEAATEEVTSAASQENPPPQAVAASEADGHSDLNEHKLQEANRSNDVQEDHADVLAALASLTPIAGENFFPLPPAAAQVEEIPAAIAELVAAAAGPSQGPRWIAQEVPLLAGEATLSLGLEMEKSYAAFAAAEAARSYVPPAMLQQVISVAQADITALPEIPPAPSSLFATIGSAPLPALGPVTNFHSEIDLIANLVTPELLASTPLTDPEATLASTIPSPEAELELRVEPESKIEAELKMQAEIMMATEAAAQPEPPEMAFAAAASAEAVTTETTPEPPRETHKERELAAAWASWRQIRETPTSKSPESEEPAAAASGAETTEESEITAEAESSHSESESQEIANIVDSVLADLKPKLMQEIARKMSKEPKPKK